MDVFTKIFMEDLAKQQAEEIRRKRQLDPNYKPAGPLQLLLLPAGIIAAAAVLFFGMAR